MITLKYISVDQCRVLESEDNFWVNRRFGYKYKTKRMEHNLDNKMNSKKNRSGNQVDWKFSYSKDMTKTFCGRYDNR